MTTKADQFKANQRSKSRAFPEMATGEPLLLWVVGVTTRYQALDIVKSWILSQNLPLHTLVMLHVGTMVEVRLPAKTNKYANRPITSILRRQPGTPFPSSRRIPPLTSFTSDGYCCVAELYLPCVRVKLPCRCVKLGASQSSLTKDH